MNAIMVDPFLKPVTVYHGRQLPEPGFPAGYAWLIDAYRLAVPLPRTLCAIGQHHRFIEEAGWQLYTPRHAPKPNAKGHMIFALKYEGLDLAVLAKLFQVIGPESITTMVSEEPAGGYVRRLWFLCEWLTGETLDLPDSCTGRYVDVVNGEQQYCVAGVKIRRQRVINNLPGSPQFCPMVFRSALLRELSSRNLIQKAQAIIDRVPRDLLARTAAFLLLKDSKSSFAIEGERAPLNRIQRWSYAIGEAGRNPLSVQELIRLQNLVIGDTRFVTPGLRQEGGFVGSHDRESGMALPDHISARPEDLEDLAEGLIAFSEGPAMKMDPVIAAAVLAFGFIYIHPFADGNGRIHRYLIHHMLARAGFNPPGLVFPVSATILSQIEAYRKVLEEYSGKLITLIDWQPLDNGNVMVLNETAVFYRFFDATPHAEFLYDCVKQTIETDLPAETDFLCRYDRFRGHIEKMIDMPDTTYDRLFRFLHQNNGKLSARAREKEFSALTGNEIRKIEQIYVEAFLKE